MRDEETFGLTAALLAVRRIIRFMKGSADVTFTLDQGLYVTKFKVTNNLDGGAPPYTRPNTGNHPDHPPVPGGYRGSDFRLARPWSDAQQVINPGLATEAVIDVPAELEGRE